MKTAARCFAVWLFTLASGLAGGTPCDWTVAIVPRLDWTAGEISAAREWLLAAEPDVIAAIGRPEWLNSQAPAGAPALVLAPLGGERRETENDGILLQITRISPAPNPGSVARPLEVIRAATRRSAYGTIAISKNDEAEASRRLGALAASSDADQLVILDDAEAAGALGVDATKIVTRPRTTAAIHIDASRLATDIPPRPEHPRVPLIHLLTCRGKDIEWHVYPVTGEPALHAAKFSAATRSDRFDHSPLSLDWRPPRIPHWIDAYLSDNPALFPHLGDAAKRPPARRLRWERMARGRGFPLVHGFGERADWTDPSLAADLPGDAVRSPGLRFAYLPWSETPEDGGDDGVGIHVVELKSGRAVQLYWIGAMGGNALAATWFTDRYLLERNFGYDFTRSDERDDPGAFRKVELHSLTLYDFVTGERFALAQEDFDRRHVAGGFREKIFLPLDEASGVSPLRAAWDASQAAIDTPPAEAPISVADACKLAGLPMNGALWKKLGIWPPPETWRIFDRQENPIYVGLHDTGWEPMTESPALVRKEIPGRGFLMGLQIKSPQSGEEAKSGNPPPPGEWTTVARAPLFFTGFGNLPKTTVIRTTGEHDRLTLLAGEAGFPAGRIGRTRRWMLLLDSVSHQAWRIDFEDDAK